MENKAEENNEVINTEPPKRKGRPRKMIPLDRKKRGRPCKLVVDPNFTDDQKAQALKDYKNNYYKNYYEKNKTTLQQKYKEHVHCESCGGKYQRANRTLHLRTAKHKLFTDIKDLIKNLSDVVNKDQEVEPLNNDEVSTDSE